MLSGAKGGKDWPSLELWVSLVGKVVGCGTWGGWGGRDERVVFPAFAGLWYSHTKAWGCGERERLMGHSLLRSYLGRTRVLAFNLHLG